MDEIQHDLQQINLTDAVLAAKFDTPTPPTITPPGVVISDSSTANMTPAQIKMAKARAARLPPDVKKALTEKEEAYKMTLSDRRMIYANALFTMIELRKPANVQQLDICKVMAEDLVTHIMEKY